MALTIPDAKPAAVAPAPRVRRRSVLASRRRQAVAGLVIAGAIGFVVAEGLGNATEYYQTVPQALAHRVSLGTRQFRIMGTVDPVVTRTPAGLSFSITYAGQTAAVLDSAEPSQLFRPGIPVVLEGHWAGPYFRSDLIMIKHSADYTPPTDPARRS